MEETISYSQWGEDRLVWEYFGCKRDGFFVEVGANHPEQGSQTFLLEQAGWKGILVEPQPSCCELLRQRRPNSIVVQAACGSPEQRGKANFHVAVADSRSSLEKYTHDKGVEFVKTLEVSVLTLDEILEQSSAVKIDFLSIDVEGTELNVLKGLDKKRSRPQLIVVEDYVFTLDVHRHLTATGYKLVKRTGSNNWYVPDGEFFPTTFPERLCLFRKMYLGTPWRQFKWRLRRGQPPQAS